MKSHLKNNSVGQNNEKLTQQIVSNGRLIKEGENISVSEVQKQVNKSQALMKEVNNVTVSPTKDNKGNSFLPYVIGSSVIVAVVVLLGYYLVKKNKGKKVA